MIEHFLIMRNGLTTVGTIENVRANPEILIPGNYLANVSYVTKTGETFKRDFRYGLPTFDSTSKVNVVYRNSNPQEAFLKEDGGYFQGSLTGLGIFIGFFSFIALLLFALKKWILGCKPEVR